MIKQSNHKQTIIYPSIGLNQKQKKVPCFIKVDKKQCEYSPKQQQKFSSISHILLKNVRDAWKKIKFFNNKQTIQTIYLPEALYDGNTDIYKKYLTVLKNKKIWSYINFNLPNDEKKQQKQCMKEMQNRILNDKYTYSKESHIINTQKKEYVKNDQNKLQKTKQKINIYKSQCLDDRGLSFDQPIHITHKTIYLQCSRKRQRTQAKRQNIAEKLFSEQEGESRFRRANNSLNNKRDSTKIDFYSKLSKLSESKLKSKSINQHPIVQHRILDKYALNENNCNYCNRSNSVKIKMKDNHWKNSKDKLIL